VLFSSSQSKLLKYIFFVLLLSIFVVSAFQRIQYFDQSGKDMHAYEKAVTDLLTGVNPYQWTVESYSNPDDPGNHGFAYLPGLLYINAPLYLLHLASNIPVEYLWKIPVLLADLGVGLLLVKLFAKLRDESTFSGSLITILALLVWFFNPYFYYKNNYVYTDPLPIFFMFLSLRYLGKDDVISGAAYAVSIALKTFPYLIFPVMLVKAKRKRDFLLAGILVGLFFALPFMASIQEFILMLRGSVLVHSERFVQGRPFLFYISYFYDVELFQIIPFTAYTLMASFSGWIISCILYLLNWVRDRYMLALIPFLTFYLFTPVLNRTYLIWFIPVFIAGTYNFVASRKKIVDNPRVVTILFMLLMAVYWGFYYWYLIQWKDGFHIWRP
jgi:hypothetical protein